MTCRLAKICNFNDLKSYGKPGKYKHSSFVLLMGHNESKDTILTIWDLF